MTDRSTDKLDDAHAALLRAVGTMVSGEDYQRLLRMASTFHRYSTSNQLLLAVQGAEGVVASYKKWQTIDATDGGKCQIARGERALRVWAPIHSTRRETDQITGIETVVSQGVTRFRAVPVFHEGQLNSRPLWPAQPERLSGTPEHFEQAWEVIAGLITADGLKVQRGPIPGSPEALGSTNWTTGIVTVRDDVDPAQAFKTLLHELGHVRLHTPEATNSPARAVREVEAESVAFIVADTLGFDTSNYTIAYIASWAHGDVDMIRATAERSLAAARRIVEELETGLNITLLIDPLQPAQQSVTPHPSAQLHVVPNETPSRPLHIVEPVVEPPVDVFSGRADETAGNGTKRSEQARRLIASATSTTELVEGLVTLATTPQEAFQFASQARSADHIYGPLAARYGLNHPSSGRPSGPTERRAPDQLINYWTRVAKPTTATVDIEPDAPEIA